jgi:hypothetical protein
MVCYTNRLRFKDFERAFATVGVVELAQVNLSAQVAPEVRATFHSRFRDRDDLEALSALFVVQKKA